MAPRGRRRLPARPRRWWRPPGSAEEDGEVAAAEGSEEDRVREALERAGHVQARAARLLGMTVRQLRYRVAKFGIQVERF